MDDPLLFQKWKPLCHHDVVIGSAKKRAHDLFGNDVFPNLNQVFTESLKNVSSHVESSVCHGEIWFHTMHVTQRYQRHTVIQP